MRRLVTGLRLALVGAALVFGGGVTASAAAPSLEAVLGYPFQDGLVAAEHGGAVAWVQTVRGVRNIWVARAPDYVPRQLTANTADDGQELTNLTFSPDGARLAWVRGGDHDANWPAEGNLAPDPASSPEQPQLTIWATNLAVGGAPVKVAEGDFPAISAKGVLAFIKDKQVWTAPLDGEAGGRKEAKAERLFFDRGRDGDLVWSPDGERLAFVSNRGDHGFIGVFSGKDRPLVYLAPSTGRDDEPRWSPDGRRIAFTRQAGEGPPEPILEERPQPWSIWVADADGAAARRVWDSPKTLDGSYPEIPGEANLMWMAGDRLVFMAEIGDWQRLYSVPVAGGEPLLLTPGSFMVEHVAKSLDGHAIIYDANTGADPLDHERRHLFVVPVDRAAPRSLTAGDGIDWTPVAADDSHVAYIVAGPKAPPQAALIGMDGTGRRDLAAGSAGDYPAAALVAPKAVTFQAADGLTIHAVLFEAPGAPGRRPAVIFVHGGPPRQMLLGWHYMDYYTHAFAVNQYLATHGYVVLSINYRLGIGYGRAFNHALHAGFRGAAEYQDVLAGGQFLQSRPEVDPARIGIWGGSYGGYLTAMALAKNSDVFKVGVDLHGVHDWSETLAKELGPAPGGFEKGDRDAAMAVAFKSSPVADLSRWTSPVLLIQGDDDRNVQFHQTVDLARRLDAQGAPYEELVLPNEIHGFLRYGSWLASDRATVEFLDRHLHPAP
jgi:dipeptidyl aminopeptidase/acylaminoacyl peptidase